MENFDFFNPTRIIFGKNSIAKLAKTIPSDNRVLIVYGVGSIKKNGVYDQVTHALSQHTLFEFPGIEPNPEFNTLMKAVDFAKDNKIDFILAVGGGSVIDGCKFISAAVNFPGDPWDLLAKWTPPTNALPFGTVLTLPATGSEMNDGSVVSRRETGDKLFFKHESLFPQFSILDPETTYTLPPRQVANGIVDAFTHTMEQYLTYPTHCDIQDRFAEGILLTLIENGQKVASDPNNYDIRANIMWAACLALNGLIGSGAPHDWATHMIGHEITARHNLDHAQTLAIVLPTVMDKQRQQKHAKLLQYAERIWNLSEGPEDQRITQAINNTRSFFETVGIKTRLSDYQIDHSGIDDMIKKLEEHGRTQLGEHQDIDLQRSREILEACI